MNVIDGLRNSSKGKLRYDTEWRATPDQLERCSLPPSISSEFSDVIQQLQGLHIGDTNTRNDHSSVSSSSAVSMSESSRLDSSRGPEFFDNSHVALYRYDQSMELEAKKRVEERKSLFERHSSQLHEEKAQILKKQYEERRDKFLELVQVLKQDLKNYEIEAAKSQEALARQHEKSAARASKKVQHLQELKKRMAEEEAKNKKELAILQKCHEETSNIFIELENIIKRCGVKDHLSSNTTTIVEEAKKVCNLSVNTLDDCISAGKPVDRAMQHLPQYCGIMKTLLNNIQQAVADAKLKEKKELAEKEAKKKEEEEKKKQEEAKKQEEKLKAAKAKESLLKSISTGSIKEYARLEKLLEDVNKSLEPLMKSSDKSVKKLKMALQRAVATPINTISDQSPALLLEKISFLGKLLSGQQFNSLGNSLSTSVHPNALLYCKNVLAQKLVQQGSQQVSSNHNAAFPFAAVIIGIWSAFPDVGDLILAHFYNQCPFLVPMYIPQSEGMSDQEYFTKLGYLCENGEIEPRDKYLKRISGTIRLYAAVVSSVPPGLSANHPHGIDRAWTWLARILNLPPKPDYTATALYEFLEVAGHALQKQYRKQFWKLIIAVVRELIPKIKQITSPSQSGPVVRLESFLEKAFQSRSMVQPTGYLDAYWWNTTGYSGVVGN